MSDDRGKTGDFEELLGLKNNTSGDGKPEDKAPEPDVATVSKEELDKVKAELDELKKNKADPQKLEQVEKNNEVISRIRDIFTAKDPKEEDDVARRKMLTEYDEDPITFLEKFVEERIAPVAENLHKVKVDSFAKGVMDQIDKEYTGIDWAKDGKKVAEQLNKLSPEYKRQDPKGAAEFAMHMAGVGKKRENPGDFPYHETSGMAAAIQKQEKADKDKYKEGIFNAAKEENADALKGFF